MCPADCLHFVIVLNYFFFHKQSGYKEAEWQEDQFRIPQQKRKQRNESTGAERDLWLPSHEISSTDSKS